MSQLKISPPVRLLFGLALAALGGVGLALAFPPYEIWPLAFVALVPILIAQYRILPPKVSSLASGVGIFIWLQGYIGPVFAPVGTFMVWLPLIVGVISFLTDSSLRSFHNRTAYRWFIPASLVNWSGAEMIRLFIPIAGTWAFIAYPLYRQVWLIQPASLFGIIGVGMFVILINHILAWSLMAYLDRRWKLAEDAALIQPRLLRDWQVAAGGIVVA